MADQTVNIKVKVTKEGSGVQDTANDLRSLEKQAGGAANSIKSAFGGMGSVMAGVGIAFGTQAIVGFAKDTIMAASDASESINKMQVVFGSASGTITAFAATAARDLGLSKTQAIEAAGTFGNLFTSMGLGQTASANMSRSLVELAADLGSFNNIPIDVMLEKLRSGMVGEVEPLRTVGINLSAAAVQAKALQMGLADASGEVSQAATLQARYALMVEQSSNAQGDFVRTSDGLANSMKTANAEMADLKVQLGELTIKPYTIAVQTAVTGLGNVSALLKTTSSDPTQKLEGLQAQLAAAKKEVAAMEGASGKGILGGFFNQKYSPEQIAQANQGITDLENRIAYLANSLKAAGDVGTGAAQINLVPELQNVTQTVAGTGSVAHSDAVGVISAVNGVAGAVSSIKIPPPVAPQPLTSSIPGFASGTSSAPGGMSLVGERGPELVNLPRGAQIYTAEQTARMLGLPAYANGAGPGFSFAGQLMAAQKINQEVVALSASEVQRAHDEAVSAELDRIRQIENANSRAADAIQAKWSSFAGAITSALDDASAKAKGLFDLGGGGAGAGGIVTEPGQNGPFEALYRLTDIAATQAGRAPGADTARWQQMYAGQDATGIARNFQAGNLLAKGVFENIDWGMLGQQAQQQEQASKISTYAGQAAANLTKAGKPLTAEGMASEIEKLAAKDKANLVPELQNVTKAVTDTGTTAHTDAASITDGLAAINSTLTGKQAPPPTTTPPTPPNPPGGGGPPEFAGGTPYAPGGLALVGERGPELVNLPIGARVFTAGQTDSILAGLALRSFAAGTAFAPGGLALVGERGPELVQIPQPRTTGGSGGQDKAQATAQFMTDLAKAINAKASTSQQAADALADMLVNAASANVQQGMLRQLARR